MKKAPANPKSWAEANQRYLMSALRVVRSALDRHAARAQGKEVPDRDAAADKALAEAEAALPAPSSLQSLCASFHLSNFERDVLLLCVGMELDSGFAEHCAAAQGDAPSASREERVRKAYPTFSLALAALPEAHWSALAPSAPLRRWRLIEITGGLGLVVAPLRIDERVLHFLAGVNSFDDRLQGLVEAVPDAEELPPSQQAIAQDIAALISGTKPNDLLPLVQICSANEGSSRAVAAWACRELGLRVHAFRHSDVPGAAAEREALARLWEREAILSNSALLVEADEVDAAECSRTLVPMLESLRGIVLINRREPLRLRNRPVFRFEIPRPSAAEQKALWRQALGEKFGKLNGHVDKVVSQFNLGPRAIKAASAELNLRAQREEELGSQLWAACRSQAQARLDDLAQRITPAAEWADLVLPHKPQLETLQAIATHVRQRTKVYETWGFAAKGTRGLGISALFAGASGTGKTMAAEVLARDLELDLYRIDLSSVVSKYIGETEKNLRRVFDAAEESGAILLFDEADALFGKRSEVKDSHDRYANIEVSYLLQRMEAYRGLAILTTNMKEALDTAFLRRIRFIVQFPFPDAAQRAKIWMRIFPKALPVDMDPAKLSRLNVAGGNIRNIAMNAAFLAADPTQPLNWSFLPEKVRTHPDAISRFLWDQFPSTAREVLWDPGSSPQRRRSIALEALSKLLQGPSIYDGKRFAGISLSRQTRDLNPESPRPEDLPQLNLRLLQDAFAAEIAENPGAVRIEHLQCAARSEYLKMEKPLTEAEIGGLA